MLLAVLGDMRVAALAQLRDKRGGESREVEVLVVDNAGTRPLSEFKRALADDGVYVSVGGQKGGRVLGPAGRLIRTASRPSGRASG